VTTRGPDRRYKSEEGDGLGLGLFIAKTLLERSGATLAMRNAHGTETGAILTVTWSRSMFEKGRDVRKIETISLPAALARMP
jgi:two-component system sensor histidine kinase RegB